MYLPGITGDLPPTGEVCQVMALWADGLIVQPDPTTNGTPTPGLAARICLLGHDLSKPLAGDGALTAYLYDARAPLSDKAIPREIWNIDSANLQQVLGKDALGWGYDLWLPWRTYRPEITQVRLVVKFQARNGKVTWSSSTDYAVRRLGVNSVTASHQQPAPIKKRDGDEL
jgi:hypothetical protein